MLVNPNSSFLESTVALILFLQPNTLQDFAMFLKSVPATVHENTLQTNSEDKVNFALNLLHNKTLLPVQKLLVKIK